MIISILEVASNWMMLHPGLRRPSAVMNILSRSYPRPTLMKKNSLPSSQRYVLYPILAYLRFLKNHFQATIHQLIPAHPITVTLYHTLETSAYLLLLDFVPSQDLFCFLEQARDRYDIDITSDPVLNCSPPIPDHLSSCHPSWFLSYTVSGSSLLCGVSGP